jgi:hypothetical protein
MDDTPHRRADDNQGIVRRHGGKASIIALVATALLQNAGVVPSAHRLISGEPSDANAAEHQALKNEVQKQTESIDRHTVQQKEALDRVNQQLQWQRETTAQGLRILCLTQAKTDTQRYECGKIQ